ncbi:MAG: DUF814 domain-containing protein [Pseudarcicella sp.]|nr:DUF814 domain-containing protein [Pseudarcicella sp.]
MQNNYYFLRRLSAEIFSKLNNFILLSCFSQEKDELVLEFFKPQTQTYFYIKAILKSDFCCLTFPSDFKRANRNTVDIFKQTIDNKVVGFTQFENERAFSLDFARNNYRILFKMYGNRANIILFQGNEAVDQFHHKFKNDQLLDLSLLHRPIVQDEKSFNSFGLKATFPTFSKQMLNILGENCEWTTIQNHLKELNEGDFYVVKTATDIELTNKPNSEEVLAQSPSAIQASNFFNQFYAKINILEKEKNDYISLLNKKVDRNQAYIDKCILELQHISNAVSNEEIGHILMANLHQIKNNTDSVVLHDFYRDQEIMVKLKKELTPQANAENYYRKSKNKKKEIENLHSNINKKEIEIEQLLLEIEGLTAIESIKSLRKITQPSQSNLKVAEKIKAESLFKHFRIVDYDVFVGKNAKNNDLLTLKYAHKDDIWLHAKDVAGSHVVIKSQAGKSLPVNVLEKAASLAGYYSKRKNDTLCPVIYTEKKFVRKAKGMADGQVIVEKENIILMEPRLLD